MQMLQIDKNIDMKHNAKMTYKQSKHIKKWNPLYKVDISVDTDAIVNDEFICEYINELNV